MYCQVSSCIIIVLTLALLCSCLAPHEPWDRFNLTPASRMSRPRGIRSSGGNVHGRQNFVGSCSTSGIATFSGEGSFVVLDFGLEVWITRCVIPRIFNSFSLSFAESPQFINPVLSDDSCRSAATMDSDGIQSLPNSAGMYRDNETTILHPQDGNFAVLFNVTQTQEQNEAISKGLTQFWAYIGPRSPELVDTIIPFIGGFELRARFIAGQGERALDLMHSDEPPDCSQLISKWGYMFTTNLSAESTLPEGFTGNGFLAYRTTEGYNFDLPDISHNHGWATGPTSALTFHVLGIALTSPLGRTWSITPVLSGLEAVECGFETSLGWFCVEWNVKGSHLATEISIPKGTSGVVKLPGTGSIHVNGEESAESIVDIELDGGDYNSIRSLFRGSTSVILQRHFA
ncbi:hypothetical protein AN958_07996 [Leucoagaricus sp. SymC.cos]|nr:hypothetical protein AN958_07996 [Leucoagaricus sp. SymC.cos]